MHVHPPLLIARFVEAEHAPYLASLTALLHRSYGGLANRRMRFFASHQNVDVTLERLNKGEGYLAFSGDSLVGTISLYGSQLDSPCPYYCAPGVFTFGQFAVDPLFQRMGFGSKLMDLVEARARELGAHELALDTAEGATDLIAMYEKRGYQQVGFVSWEVTNYRSVIMSKKL